jgi:hypothetical protein
VLDEPVRQFINLSCRIPWTEEQIFLRQLICGRQTPKGPPRGFGDQTKERPRFRTGTLRLS